MANVNTLRVYPDGTIALPLWALRHIDAMAGEEVFVEGADGIEGDEWNDETDEPILIITRAPRVAHAEAWELPKKRR
jgi:hypothetical protein